MRSCRFTMRTSGVGVGVFFALVCLTPLGRAEDAREPAADAANAVLNLQACQQIALGQQPVVAAAQIGVKAALDRNKALNDLRVPNFLARDLPIRRKQSSLGIVIAEAGVTQAEAETVYAVTFSYLTALYAAQEIKIADKQIRPRLEALLALVTDPMIAKRRRDVIIEQHANLARAYLQTLNGRRQEAEQGRKRALAALREAMGVGPEFALVLPDRDLPCPQFNLRLEQLTALALARRAEVIQAAVLADVVCLEVEAQGTSCRPNMRTFASGSDIHAKPIPTGNLGGVSYRPAIVGPEMPAFLTGSRCARVTQARDYHARAEAVATKSRGLVALEVEDLYRRWLEKARKAAYLENAYQESLKFSDRLKASFNTNEPTYPNVDEILNAGIVTSRLQLEWQEAHYQALLSLAALERATARGFHVDFDAAPACKKGPLELPDEQPAEKLPAARPQEKERT